jgi:hypothetical protein
LYDYFILGDLKKKYGAVRLNNISVYTWIRRLEFKRVVVGIVERAAQL